jgi:phytoene synthase
MSRKTLDDKPAKEKVLTIVKKSGSSFYWAMRLLPLQKREAIFSIYAFCREVDDIADGDNPTEIKRLKLKKWRTEIDNLFEGSPQNLIACALAKPIKNYSLKKEDFIAVINGMETDSSKNLQMKNIDALLLYCDQVACSVGRLSNAIFGLNSEQSWKLSKCLGEALQLTNILRDIHEDAALNRVYLPRDLLRKNGIKTIEITEIIKNPALVDVCKELAERARKNYNAAETISKKCNKKVIRPVLIMMKIYRRLLFLLERRGWEHINVPTKVPKLWKLLFITSILIFQR